MTSKHRDTNLMQFPPRMEASLALKRKDAVDWHTRSAATHLHLPLFADECVEISFCRLNF